MHPVFLIEDRAAAVRWARAEAGRIVRGDYDASPLGIFNAAQRMEHVLTRFQWLDGEFPRAVGDFVFGWSASGPEADAAIRASAAELHADRTPDGPPRPPRD